mgnify:CR=1 FL=1
MIAMRLSELAAAIGARLVGADREFAGVVADSRKLEAGQLFVALRGERVDGHDFVADVAARGAAAAVVERELDVSASQLVVANAERALAEIDRDGAPSGLGIDAPSATCWTTRWASAGRAPRGGRSACGKTA